LVIDIPAVDGKIDNLFYSVYVFYMEINYKNGIISADRAKQIKTKAIVNEDPTEALIRELRQALP
jgi:hypothetical protein